MSDTQDNTAFSEAGTSRACSIAAFLMLALILGAGGLHYTVMNKQKLLTQVAAAGRQQYALTQRIGFAVAQYQKTHDERQLQTIKDAASASLASYDVLAPLILSPTAHGTLNDGMPVQAEELATTLHNFIDKSFTFAAAPGGDGAQATAEAVMTLAQQDIPDAWNAEVASYASDQQQEINLLDKIGLGLYALLPCVLAYMAFALMPPAFRHIARQREKIEHMAATDPLTGAYNRAMLYKVAAMLIGSARRHKSDLAALAVDIDGVGKINETYGRAAADAAIRRVAGTLSEVLRTSDVMGRVSGGEFAIFLPSTDAYRASLAAEKLRAAVADLPFAVKERTVLLRVSIGVVQMQENHKTPDDVLRAAEAALKRAKEEGRDRVVVEAVA